MKLFFAEAGSLEQLEATLESIATEASARVDVLRARAEEGLEGSSFPERQHVSTVCLRLALEQEMAVLRWVQWARAQVADWRGAGDPGEWDVREALGQMADDARLALA